MSLTKSTLSSALTTMFTVKPIGTPTMTKHFEDFAKLYDDYAKEAIESGGGNGLATTGKTTFQSTMSSYSLLPVPILSGYASYIELACIAYWGSSSFKKLLPPPGMSSITSITIIPMTPMSLQTNLLNAINQANGNATLLASKMADEIHTNTKTVKVTISGLSTAVPPVPITLSNLPIS